jgi:hypothetical protein
VCGAARFADALPGTAVGFMYMSEHALGAADPQRLKARMRDAIRANRLCARPPPTP